MTQPAPQTAAAVLWIRAQWHRAQSRDFLNKSVQSMYQHEKEADELERRARELTRKEMQA